MVRITEQSMLNSSIGSIQRNFKAMEASQRRLSTGQRIQSPHEDVAGTVNSIFYRTRINSIDQYEKNITSAQGRMDILHDTLGQVSDTLNNARELAVQGANGTYTKEDRVAMASEVEEMIRHLSLLSQAKYKGEYIFSGNKVTQKSFRLEYKQNDKLGREVVVAAHYDGDNGKTVREIDDQNYIDIGSPGSHAFWAENSTLTASEDAKGFIAPKDQKIMIDDQVIQIAKGDTVDAVADKINKSGGNVKAEVVFRKTGEKVLQFTTREPHKVLFQDLEGGTTLQDLGVIRKGLGGNPENNYHPGLSAAGHSTFDVLMRLRDNLLNDNVAQIGSTDLGLIDEAMSNTLHNQAKISARVERIGLAEQHFADEKVAIQEALSKTEDIDYSKEMVEFKMWEYVHTASLQTAAKLLKPTLMDYLR